MKSKFCLLIAVEDYGNEVLPHASGIICRVYNQYYLESLVTPPFSLYYPLISQKEGIIVPGVHKLILVV